METNELIAVLENKNSGILESWEALFKLSEIDRKAHDEYTARLAQRKLWNKWRKKNGRRTALQLDRSR